MSEVMHIPPQAPDIEQAVLGAILLRDDLGMAEVSDVLKSEMMFITAHRLIYGTMERMYEAGKPIDLLTVIEELKRRNELDAIGGVYYLSTLAAKMASSAHLQYHAMILVERFIERETIRLSAEGMRKVYEGQYDVFDAVEGQIAALEGSIAANVRNRSKQYGQHEADQIDRANSPRKPAHTTGYKALNELVGGYQPGDLVIVAARPAMGKSSFAFSSAAISADEGCPTGFFSLELNAEKAQARLFSRRSGIPLAEILRDTSDAHLAKRISDHGEAVKVPLWMRYDSAMSIADIKAEATRMVRQHKVTAIFIDQLNWITPPKAQNRDGEVGQITRALKQLALKLNITVVLLHQLNRSVDTRGGNNRPVLSDLRDSGNVEQDAQVVMFLYRAEYYGITEDERGSTIGTVEVVVAKNSNGPTGSAYLYFDGPTASVSETPRNYHEQASYNPRQGFDAGRVQPEQDDLMPF
jgi:replicative DNA helicase